MDNGTQLDSFPVNELSDRYQLTRSNVYNRLSKLGIQAEKVGNKAFLNASQLEQMDRLDQHLKEGNTIEDFLVDRHHSSSPIRQSEKSYRTGRTMGRDEPPAPLALGMPSALALDSLADAIALKLTAIAPAPPLPTDPLANLRLIEEACTNGWHLSSSQLAPLLGVKSINGKEVRRYGFLFRRVGKNGSESAWKILKEESESNG